MHLELPAFEYTVIGGIFGSVLAGTSAIANIEEESAAFIYIGSSGFIGAMLGQCFDMNYFGNHMDTSDT